MSAINPNPPPQENSFSEVGTTAESLNTFGSDTISDAQFLRTIQDATRVHKEGLFNKIAAEAEQQLLSFLAFIQDAALKTEQLAALLTELSARQALWASLYQQQQASRQGSIQSQVVTVNDASSQQTLDDAVDDLNDAIQTYNNDPSAPGADATLQAAIDTYKNRVNSIVDVDSYNSKVDSYNNLVDQAEAGNPSPGVPDLHPTPAERIDLFDTLGSFPPGHVNHLGTLTSIAGSVPTPNFDVDFILTGASAIISGLLASRNIIDITSALQQLINSINPSNPTLPLAYIQRHFSHTLIETAGELTLGTSPTIVAATVGNSPAVLRVLNDSMYKNVQTQEAKPLPPHVIDLVETFAIALVSAAANKSGAAVSAQISGRGVPKDDLRLFFNVTSAIVFSNQVAGIVESGGISDQIAAIINKDAELSALPAAERVSLTKTLTAILNLSLLNIALSQIALSLSAPGLIPQVLGNAAGGVSPFQASSTQGQEKPTLQDVTNDLLSRVFLKLTVATTASDLNLGANDIANVNNVIKQVFSQNTFTNVNELGSTFQTAFEKAGLSTPNATALANSITDFFTKELENPYLYRVLVPSVPEIVANEATVTPPPANAGAKPEGPKVTPPRRRGSAEALGAGTAPSGTTAPSNPTPAPAGTESNPLLETQPNKTLSRQDLVESLTTHITEHYTGKLGTVTQTIASQTNQSVIKLLNTFNDQLKVLREQEREDAITKDVRNEFYKNIDKLSTPNLPQFVLKDQINTQIGHQLEAVVTDKASLMQQTFIPGFSPGTQKEKASTDM